jgi:hypothetical protein
MGLVDVPNANVANILNQSAASFSIPLSMIY